MLASLVSMPSAFSTSASVSLACWASIHHHSPTRSTKSRSRLRSAGRAVSVVASIPANGSFTFSPAKRFIFYT